MNFCAGCGSPNFDTDATCRVCGRSLSENPGPQPAATTTQSTDQGTVTPSLSPSPPPVATAVAEPTIPSRWPDHSGSPVEPNRLHETSPVNLPPAGVATPSGFERSPVPHLEPTARPDGALPSFMRPEARAATASGAAESASLISEHDLPDWIRQIAADDARKLAEAQAEEEVTAVAAGSSMPSHFGRRALPGETLTSGPASSSWLSRKDAVAGAAESAWDVTGAAPPSRPVVFPSDASTRAQATSAGLQGSTDAIVTETGAAPSKRRRRGSSKEKAVATPKTSRLNPLQGLSGGGSKRIYLIAAVIVALVFALAMTVN